MNQATKARVVLCVAGALVLLCPFSTSELAPCTEEALLRTGLSDAVVVACDGP